MNEALKEVRRNLGEDAVILRTRKVRRGGLLSFLSKEMIEVIAASPDRTQITEPKPQNQSKRLKKGLDAQASSEIIQDLRDEIKDLKGNVYEIAEQVKYDKMPSLPTNLKAAYKRMIMSGVEERLASRLVQELNLNLTGNDLAVDNLVNKSLHSTVKNYLQIRPPQGLSNSEQKVFALIGPTGVGKTTTLAKLVTSYRHWGKGDNVLISADTYRIAAIEQLKTFAAIAGMPMEAVYQPEGMKNTLNRHTGRDGIFIDTAGRSPTDKDKLDELSDFLEAAQPTDVLLCLSVTTRFEEQMAIIERYRAMKPTGIVFTKLDESRGLGPVLNAALEASLPLTYLTFGQNVPDDIITADSDLIAKIILNPDDLPDLQKSHFKMWIDQEKDAKKQETGVSG